MNIFGIGIDMVEIQRIDLAIKRRGNFFLQRLFTQFECDYCMKKSNPALHFAARFAAKEATAKALGTGIGKNASFKEIEVVLNASGKLIVKMQKNIYSKYFFLSNLKKQNIVEK